MPRQQRMRETNRIFYNFPAFSFLASEKSRGVTGVLYAVSLVADIVDS